MSESPLYTERGQAIAKVMCEYEQIRCRTCSTAIRYDIEYYLEHDMDADVIIRAIGITQDKGADWRYTKGILKRLLEENTLTIESWDYKLAFKKSMIKFKAQYPFHSEDELLPFVLIDAWSDFPYFKNLEDNMAKFIEQEKDKEEYKDGSWLDKYWPKDEEFPIEED